MKIRSGQVGGPQQGGPAGKTGKANGRFKALLDQELQGVADIQAEITVQDRDAREQPYRLINDATQLLDDAIAQIESSESPRDKTLASLQQLRDELVTLGGNDPSLKDAQVILSVEAERLKSW